MAIIGYIRVSARDQNLDRQIELMKEQQVDKLFQEKVSGKNVQRTEFNKMLDFVREGDCLVIAALDRLGRNYQDIKETVALLKQKKVSLNVLDAQFLNFNTGNELLDTAMFDMFLSLLSYIAQNEREKTLDRQRQGIKLAKEKGRYNGRPVEYSAESNDPQKRLVYKAIVRMLENGCTVLEIAEEYKISRPTIYKIKKSNDL